MEEEERYPERIDRPTPQALGKKPPIKNITPASPKIFSTIKKVFTTPVKIVRDNSALKEVLNKALSENKTPPTPTPVPIPKPIPTPTPVSLDTLKKENNMNNNAKPSKDRAANALDMDKLKNLIETTNISGGKNLSAQAGKIKVSSVGPQPREVPEDVLRKILE